MKQRYIWFAWRPVNVSGEWVWLETVERKTLDCGTIVYNRIKRGFRILKVGPWT